MLAMNADPFWPEKETTPPEQLEAKLVAATEGLAFLKAKLAECSDICMPKQDDSDLIRHIRVCQYNGEKALEATKKVFSCRDTNMYITNTRPSTLVIASIGKNNLFWPEIWTTPDEEINDKLVMIQLELKLLKEKLACEPGFIALSEDDSSLMRFLRVRKYNHNRAFSLIRKYFEVRSTQLFDNYLPSAKLKNLLKNLLALSPCLDHQGRLIAFFQVERWDPSTLRAEDLFLTALMGFEAMSFQPSIQIAGVVLVFDCKNIEFRHIRSVSPFTFARMLEVYFRSTPLKIKGLHFVNDPVVSRSLYNIIKPFLAEKTKSRVHFHGSQMASLHKHIPPEFLPADYEGDLEAFNTDGVVETILEEEHIFHKLKQYTYNSRNK